MRCIINKGDIIDPEVLDIQTQPLTITSVYDIINHVKKEETNDE